MKMENSKMCLSSGKKIKQNQKINKQTTSHPKLKKQPRKNQNPNHPTYFPMCLYERSGRKRINGHRRHQKIAWSEVIYDMWQWGRNRHINLSHGSCLSKVKISCTSVETHKVLNDIFWSSSDLLLSTRQ